MSSPLNDPGAALDLVARCTEAGWRRIAFIGTSKHAGKTTAMNGFIASAVRQGRRLGIASVGLDGEWLDTILGLPKPRVFAPEGALVASAEGALAASSARFEYLEELPIPTPLGSVLVAQVTMPGHVVLAGVRRRSDVALALPALEHLGAEFCLLDGAFERVAAAAPELIDAAVVAVGAVLGASPDEVARRAAAFLRRFQLPETPEELKRALEPAHRAGEAGYWTERGLFRCSARQVLFNGVLGARMGDAGATGVGRASEGYSPEYETGPDGVNAPSGVGGDAQVGRDGSECDLSRHTLWALYLPGAITDVLLRLLLAQVAAPLHLVAAHPAQITAGEAALRAWFAAGHQLSVWRSLPLAAVAVNPHNLMGDPMSAIELQTAVATVAPDLPIYDALSTEDAVDAVEGVEEGGQIMYRRGREKEDG
jgi:hypothetical protein